MNGAILNFEKGLKVRKKGGEDITYIIGLFILLPVL